MPFRILRQAQKLQGPAVANKWLSLACSLPRILTVRNWDYNRGYYNPYEGLSVEGGPLLILIPLGHSKASKAMSLGRARGANLVAQPRPYQKILKMPETTYLRMQHLPVGFELLPASREARICYADHPEANSPVRGGPRKPGPICQGTVHPEQLRKKTNSRSWCVGVHTKWVRTSVLHWQIRLYAPQGQLLTVCLMPACGGQSARFYT